MPLLDWGRNYLPEHFRLPPSKMHHWLAERLDAMRHERGARLNIIGPRGGAKSTLGTLAHVLRVALENWEPYIWIVSDTRHQACCHLENIKSELLDNRAIARDYGESTRPAARMRASGIQLSSGSTIEAFGTGQRIRGRRRRAHRPTLIVCDDVQNDQHMASPLVREYSARWFHGTLMKAGTKRTNVLHLATALHRDALALELHRSPAWRSRIFQAIQSWPANISLWHEWETIYSNLENPEHQADARSFFERNRVAMEEGAELLWPEEEDLYTLMQMRIEGGRTAFEREKQGCPLNPDLCEWPEEYFDEHIWFDDWPTDLRLKAIALDPSKGQNARHSDYSAFVLLGIDGEGYLYVQADLARRPTPQIVADGVELCRTFRPDALAIESNQFQELLGAEFQAELTRQGIWGIQPWSLDNRVNKLVRIRRLGPFLSSKRLRFKACCPSTKLLVEQLREFPACQHDDGPDALEMAIRLASELHGAHAAGDGLGDRLVY